MQIGSAYGAPINQVIVLEWGMGWLLTSQRLALMPIQSKVFIFEVAN